MRSLIAITAAAGIALTGAVLVAPAASAKDGDIKQRGACSTAPGASDWVVKVKPKKGQLRADFWVKNNAPVGQSWTLAVVQGDKTTTVTKATRSDDDGGDDGDDDSRHTAEVKWRTWASANGVALAFTATGPNGETCVISVPWPTV